MKIRQVLLALALTGVVCLIGSSSVLATGSLGVRPVNPNEDFLPRSTSIFIYNMNPDETKNDAVAIVNASDKSRSATLGVVDGMTTNTGSYTCRQEADPVQDAAGWITLAKKEVAVDANATENVAFTVAVPSNAAPGEHNACITVQDADGGDTMDGGSGVQIRMRAAARVVITVPGDLKRDVNIDSYIVKSGLDMTLLTSARKIIFQMTINSDGSNVSTDVATSVKMKTLWGTEVYENHGEYPVLANSKMELTFENTKPPIWGGWYKVAGQISYDNRADRFGGASDAEQNTVTKSAKDTIIFVWPIWWALAIYIGFVLLVAFVIIRQISRKKRSNKKFNISKR